MNFVTVISTFTVLDVGLGWAEVRTQVTEAVVEHGGGRGLHGCAWHEVPDAFAWMHPVDSGILTDEFWRNELGCWGHLEAITGLSGRCEWLEAAHGVRTREITVIVGVVSRWLEVNLIVVEHHCCDSDNVYVYGVKA